MDDGPFPAERGALEGILPLPHCMSREEEEQIGGKPSQSSNKSHCGQHLETEK